MILNDPPPPFDHAWFRFLIGFMIGAAFGSFGTMLAYRLPRRLSIIFPGSRCPSCDTPLTIRDLVPILSFLSTHGKCRHCSSKIGIRYLWIELVISLFCGLLTALL